jgi:hypothetical protein
LSTFIIVSSSDSRPWKILGVGGKIENECELGSNYEWVNITVTAGLYLLFDSFSVMYTCFELRCCAKVELYTYWRLIRDCTWIRKSLY